jgi:hypothetical protein
VSEQAGPEDYIRFGVQTYARTGTIRNGIPEAPHRGYSATDVVGPAGQRRGQIFDGNPLRPLFAQRLENAIRNGGLNAAGTGG